MVVGRHLDTTETSLVRHVRDGGHQPSRVPCPSMIRVDEQRVELQVVGLDPDRGEPNDGAAGGCRHRTPLPNAALVEDEQLGMGLEERTVPVVGERSPLVDAPQAVEVPLGGEAHAVQWAWPSVRRAAS